MRFLLTVLLALLGGCSFGPDADALKQDVAARLARAIPPDVVTLETLTRKGSQADPGAPGGETRRTIYFDAQLKVARDFDFGAWNAPGVAALVSALGAGPKGITGLKPGGNKAGDVLRVHGTALYRRDGSGWTAVAPAGYEPPAVPAYAGTMPQHGVAAAFEAMRTVIESVPKEAAPAQRAIIEEEMAAAMAAIRARLARAADGYALAAGPEHGEYLRLAQALATARTPRIVPLVTRGGDDNLRLLREGKVLLALSQGDAALDAYQGQGNFAAVGPYPGLRAMGSLYPEPVHVLVRGDSGVRTVAALKGRRVGIGVQGSAARSTALHVLAAHGLQVSDIEAREAGFSDALVMLQRGELDAVIHVIGVPADSIRAALAASPLRLLPLSETAIGRLTGANRGYFEYAIARGVYARQEEDVRTIATAAVLLAGDALSESEVASLTRFVFGQRRDLVALGSTQAAQISAAAARRALTVPLHVGAAKALDELAAAQRAPAPQGK